MSKKFLFILISVVLVLFLVCLLGYYFIIQNNSGGPNGTKTGFKSFFPFGGNSNQGGEATTTNTEPTQPTQPEQTDFTKKLRKLSSEPVSGAGLLDVKAGTIVRYIEKATGHVFETELFSPNNNRISNTTIPLVYDALWGNKNSSIIARYLKDDDQTVDTFALNLKNTSTTTENSISGTAFPANISDVSVFGESVFYLQQDTTSSAGYISNFAGTKRTQIWSSPIKELTSQYVNAKTVSLTTNPAQDIPGFMYFIDTGTGQVKKILGDIAGLSTLTNPDANKILYLGQSTNATLYIYDMKAKTNVKINPVTLPEKCVWSKKDKNALYCAVPRSFIGGDSLTSWYLGQVSFSDDIWKYDIANNTASIIMELSDEPIDAIKLELSDSEQYLVFINKTDNALWSLDLTK